MVQEKKGSCFLKICCSVKKMVAEVEYTFLFDAHEVVYQYSKKDVNTLVKESLSIDGEDMIKFDFTTRFTSLEDSDTLNALIKSDSPISRIKYVNSNAILTDNTQNHVFKKFMNFVDHMDADFYKIASTGTRSLTLFYSIGIYA